MSGKQFDQIAQEILKQKQRMDKLQAENADLRQQIADLRSGRGIFVDICGSRFALRNDTSHAQAKPTSAVQSTSSPLTATSTSLEAQPLQQQIVDAPTAEIVEITPQALEQSTKAQEAQGKNEAGKKSAESTFLEEILLDEFNNALTSPNSVWQDPAEKKQSQPQRKSQEAINEEQKAALRRELMGSFLLE